MSQRIWVTVKPQARKEEIAEIAAGEYRVAVRARAQEGKANEAVIELLAEYFSVPKSTVKIVRGQTSRKKLIEIS